MGDETREKVVGNVVISPAMTPEGWADFFEYYKPGFRQYEIGSTASNHAAAAMLLHGQPFGFTREDIRDLVEASCQCEIVNPDLADRCISLADRIEALLPPEEA